MALLLLIQRGYLDVGEISLAVGDPNTFSSRVFSGFKRLAEASDPGMVAKLTLENKRLKAQLGELGLENEQLKTYLRDCKEILDIILPHLTRDQSNKVLNTIMLLEWVKQGGSWRLKV